MSNYKKWKMKAHGDSAEIMIFDEIGEGMFEGLTAKDFRAELKGLGSPTDLTVRINSPGGSVFEGMAIYQALKAHPATVNVEIEGLAASIASVIAMAGDRVAIAETARMMIHSPWAVEVGGAGDFRKTADRLDQLEDQIIAVYQKRVGISKDDFKVMMAEETWMDGHQAVEHGFADVVLDGAQEIAASMDRFDLSRFRNVPNDLAGKKDPDSKLSKAWVSSTTGAEIAVQLAKLDADEAIR